MPVADIFIVLRFWATLFLIGAAAYPLTKRLFSSPAGSWHDHGYLFAKSVGIAIVTWIVYVLGMTRMVPFTSVTIAFAIGIVFCTGIFVLKVSTRGNEPRGDVRKAIALIGIEELFFLLALIFWSWVKAHEPSIRGLEKFMDYGFMQSILNSRFFPPADMWYPPFPINYYYFGHMVTAVLTKLSGLELAYTFNLMLSTIFAFTITMSFSIGYQLIMHSSLPVHRKKLGAYIGGGLTAFLVTLGGNMQTIYAFTRGYTGDDVRPFWVLTWNIGELVSKLPEGMERYWYANATRFIPYTIHEFPSYSFVVSDIHGHVLSIPFVLLAIGLLIASMGRLRGKDKDWGIIIFYGFLCGVLLMTNALDGPIYLGLFALLALANNTWQLPTVWGTRVSHWNMWGTQIGIVIATAVFTSLPFLIHFKSFVNGIAVNCPLPFFANSRIGPIIFESIDKCQRSPVWMMWLLWGFFIFCGVALISRSMFRGVRGVAKAWRSVALIEKMLIVFFVFSLLLIIFPEFFYFKDIYPQHFRSNTMFKLGYQAFILFSIMSGYTIVHMWVGEHPRIARTIFFVLLVPQLFLVSIYPLFSVRSYFGGLNNYEGLYGLTWLMREHPDDYHAIRWLLSRQKSGATGVLVESDGDSYSPKDENRISAFTGMPTIIGWAVHEWLWRGTYDVVSPRREEVRKIYESDNLEEVRHILQRYDVAHVVVGKIERDKFPNLIEGKFSKIGREVFRSGETVLYEVSY